MNSRQRRKLAAEKHNAELEQKRLDRAKRLTLPGEPIKPNDAVIALCLATACIAGWG
jgi:hypothetical protein